MKSKITDLSYLRLISPEIVRRLISFEGVKKLIVFGSVSQQMQTDNSDMDILVIKDSKSDRYRDMINIRKSLRGLSIPIDVLVIEESEFLERIKNRGSVYYWANKTGKVLYDSI